MCNQTVKENLLTIASPYFDESVVLSRETRELAKRTIVLACKAIDAYDGNLDELSALERVLDEIRAEASL